MFSSLPKKVKLKIKNNVKKVKKVLQNGYKYPQNSSTSFSINFIALISINLSISFIALPVKFIVRCHGRSIALSIGRFDEISLIKVSNNKVSNNGYKYPQNSSTSFSINFIALSVNNQSGGGLFTKLNTSVGAGAGADVFVKLFAGAFVFVFAFAFMFYPKNSNYPQNSSMSFSINFIALSVFAFVFAL